MFFFKDYKFHISQNISAINKISSLYNYRYILTKLLLIGAFGTVYKGTASAYQTDDTTEVTDVAVKTINAGTIHTCNKTL